MQKVWWIVPVVLGGLVLAAVPYGVRQQQRTAENLRRAAAFSHISPDQQTRQIMAGIKPSEIASLKLFGVDMGCFSAGNPPAITVRDADVIGSFVRGLQHATIAGNIRIGNGVDNLEIHFKTLRGHTREPLYFDFNPTTPALWYGDEFAQAIRRLGRFQAAQVRAQAAHFGADQVAWVQWRKTRLSDPAQVAPVWRAIQNVDGRAYAYDARGGKAFDTLKVGLKNGKTLGFYFQPSSQVPNAQLQPLWDLYGIR